MALSNLRNEPRREIIEQVAGLGLIAGLIGLDYGVARLFGPNGTGEMILAMMMAAFAIIIGTLIIYFLIFGAHVIGEIICDMLDDLGADPRPTERHRR